VMEENYDSLSIARGALLGVLLSSFCWAVAGVIWLLWSP
jgi:hypothetical protein